MSSRTITSLEYALLGLIRQQPRSGYDLRRTFASTPLKHFSQSPGAIYPALARLERRGLLKGNVLGQDSLRPRKVYRLSTAGLRELKAWLRQPVSLADVIWHNEILILRLSFMSGLLPRREIIRFLRSLEAYTRSHLASLVDYFHEQSGEMPASSRLAFQGGMRSYQGWLELVSQAITEFGREERTE